MRCTLVFLVLMAGCASSRTGPPLPSHNVARLFVEEYAVGLENPDIHTVRSLIRALTSRNLFVRVDRRTMARWHRDPPSRTAWLTRLHRFETRVHQLRATAEKRLLDGEEAAGLARARRIRHQMRHQDAAWREVYAKAHPADYPFVLTGRRALELGVLDGCTTASRTFCQLARAAGLEIRLVNASSLDALRSVWRAGRNRTDGNVNGHKMALVRLQGQWLLVNTNWYRATCKPSYEILDEVAGTPVSPETLPGMVLRLPSMQVNDGRRSPELVVTSVGPPDAEDLGEFSKAGNLNLAVSGDPASPICSNPALMKLLGGE